MRYSFIIATDEEYGFRDLRPEWMNNANAFQGLTAAHDIMEHFPNAPLDSDGEAMALGAMLYVRAKGGYFSSWDIGRIFYSDISNFLMNASQLRRNYEASSKQSFGF